MCCKFHTAKLSLRNIIESKGLDGAKAREASLYVECMTEQSVIDSTNLVVEEEGRIGVFREKLLDFFLSFYRCWEESETHQLLKLLEIPVSSCFSARAYQDADFEIIIKCGRTHGLPLFTEYRLLIHVED